jgi:predicted phosphoribosyltransferase
MQHAPIIPGREIELLADAVYCANLRSEARFAVADAYAAWRDVDEDEAIRLLDSARRRAPAS